MKKTLTQRIALLFSAALLTLLPITVEAQNNTNDNSNKVSDEEDSSRRRFWQANLPGGSYIVALDRISSISKHTYILNGNLRVTEVVVDTNGNSLARFYYIIPVTEDSNSNAASRLTSRSKELLDRVGERTGVNANTAVAKQYPNTTHAKTVEFRISDEGNLNQLFSSARTAWTKGRGRKFTIVNE